MLARRGGLDEVGKTGCTGGSAGLQQQAAVTLWVLGEAAGSPGAAPSKQELEEVGWGQDLGLDLVQLELAAQRNTSWPRVAA